MKFLLFFCFILIFSSISFAESKRLHTDSAKQSILSKSNTTKFNHAVQLLDGYRGDTSNLEEAHKELENILKDSPSYPPAHREMGRYHIMRGHISSLKFQPGSLEAAEKSINKAIEISPNYPEAYVLLGHLYRLMDRHNDAIAALQKAEKIGTTDPWLQNNWADILIDDGNYEEAAKRYHKVLESKTKNKKAMGAAFEGLTRYYRGLGKLDQADKIYRKNIEYEPDAAWNYGNYGQFLLCDRDDYEQSIKRSREALKIMDYGVGRYFLASALYRKWAQSVLSGTPDSGKQFFIEAQGIYPNVNEIAADTENCPSLKKIAEALAQSAG